MNPIAAPGRTHLLPLWAGLLALAAAPLGAAATALTVGNVTGAQGSEVVLPITLAGSAGVTALQLDVAYDSSRLIPGLPAGGAALAGHMVASNVLTNNALRVLIYSLNNAAMTNGVVVNLAFTIASRAPTGPAGLVLTNVILAQTQGNRVTPVQLANGTVTIIPATPARLDSLARSSDGQVGFRLTGAPNQSYVIQASTNLTSWLTVSTNVAVGGSVRITDSAAKALPLRFYRAFLPQ